MTPTNRRAFLSDVGRGMLAAGLGASLASDLGFSTAFAEQGSDSIPLGEYKALVVERFDQTGGVGGFYPEPAGPQRRGTHPPGSLSHMAEVIHERRRIRSLQHLTESKPFGASVVLR